MALPAAPTAHPQGVTGLPDLYFFLTYVSILFCRRTGGSTVHTQGFKSILSPGSDSGQAHRSSLNTSPAASAGARIAGQKHRGCAGQGVSHWRFLGTTLDGTAE